MITPRILFIFHDICFKPGDNVVLGKQKEFQLFLQAPENGQLQPTPWCVATRAYVYYS